MSIKLTTETTEAAIPVVYYTTCHGRNTKKYRAVLPTIPNLTYSCDRWCDSKKKDESEEEAISIFEWFMEDDAARVRDTPGAWKVIGEIGMLLEDGELLTLGGEMRLGIGGKRPYGHGYGW